MPCCMTFTINPISVLKLSPENEPEVVKAPATLSFHADAAHLTSLASTKAFICADIPPM